MSFVFLGLRTCDLHHIHRKLQRVPSSPFSCTLNRPEKSVLSEGIWTHQIQLRFCWSQHKPDGKAAWLLVLSWLAYNQFTAQVEIKSIFTDGPERQGKKKKPGKYQSHQKKKVQYLDWKEVIPTSQSTVKEEKKKILTLIKLHPKKTH